MMGNMELPRSRPSPRDLQEAARKPAGTRFRTRCDSRSSGGRATMTTRLPTVRQRSRSSSPQKTPAATLTCADRRLRGPCGYLKASPPMVRSPPAPKRRRAGAEVEACRGAGAETSLWRPLIFGRRKIRVKQATPSPHKPPPRAATPRWRCREEHGAPKAVHPPPTRVSSSPPSSRPRDAACSGDAVSAGPTADCGGRAPSLPV